MGVPKKIEFENPINAKIQQKFDLIFGKESIKKGNANDNLQMGGDSMSDSSAKKIEENKCPKLDLDFEENGTEIEFDNPASQSASKATSPKAESAAKLAVVPDDNELDFTLDFGDDSPEVPSLAGAENFAGASSTGTGSLDIPSSLDSNYELDTMFDAAIEDSKVLVPEGTQKTILFEPNQLAEIGLLGAAPSEIESFKSISLESENTLSVSSSADLMSNEEARVNIETTIKDIIRPKILESAQENTQDIDLSGMEKSEDYGAFAIDAAGFDDDNSLDSSIDFNAAGSPTNISDSGNFDLSSVEFADTETSGETLQEKKHMQNQPQIQSKVEVYEKDYEDVVEDYNPKPSVSSSSPIPAHASFVSDEESTRVQATIRQLREEREEFLGQIKMIKGNYRELEQDNLTLKAALDESKIEVSILRKRHMTELEDIRYRLSLNEEKKSIAEEKARQAIGQKEKLEQRVRIDFNQVKQREKELETRLEMLTIDVDSQVQSRDQKILELRRKIDSLEFNMENVSIKEHKSQDDKRKLEDKLNKIMKTLRHSIKNLEDDIDQATEDSHDGRQNTDHRSGKA